MNPTGEGSPRFELPPQGQEQGVEEGHESAQQVETTGEGAAGKQQPQLTPPPQTTTTVQPPALPVPATPASTAQPPVATQDLTAQDVNLIEKQWVHRTKAVINKNKDDPFKQKDEVSRVKADYVKKRFNKVIPTDDTVAA